MIETRKSKIVAKIADNRSDIPFLKDVFRAGVDVAWLNTAHQNENEALEVIKRIRSVTTKIPIMIDTKGPEVRTQGVEKALEVKAGDSVVLSGDSTLVGPNVIHVSYSNFHNEVPVGESVLYDDASIEMVVKEKVDRGLKCEIKSNGVLKNKKSLNIPNIHISLPALSEKDKGFMHFCAKNDIDFIIHSFVRNVADINEIKDILKQYPDYKGKIIAKIENREGFDNVKEILENCEGLMVARGDLGAEVPLEELPYMQKKMIEAALIQGKYCIVATQVLESMIKNPRPTRAEVTDIANAILDGSGAISMSGETAYGDYPFEAISTMGRVMKYTESKRNELVHFSSVPDSSLASSSKASEIIAEARATKAQAIVVLSNDMDLVRAISAHRPEAVIVPVCTSGSDARELMLAYAVRPIVADNLGTNSIFDAIHSSSLPKGQNILVVEQVDGGYNTKVTTAEKSIQA